MANDPTVDPIVQITPPVKPCDTCVWQPTNPLWATVKQIAAQILLLAIILWFSANNFDETEITVIAIFAGALGFDAFAAFTGLKAAVKKKVTGK